MSYPRSLRPHQDSIRHRNSVQYPCSSQSPSLDPSARSYLSTQIMAAPMSNYPSTITRHPSQSHPIKAYSASFSPELKSQADRAKHNLYDYGPVNDPSTSLQHQSCDNCGYQYRCTRNPQSRSSATLFLPSCDRCLANSLPCTTSYTMNYPAHSTSFPSLTHSSGLAPNSNYERPVNNPSPRSSSLYATTQVPSSAPSLGNHDLANAPSPNCNCPSRSNASKSTSASPATSHSAASSAGKEGFEPAVKRPHARGYITTLDARLSRLEAMLGELVPSAAEQLKPGIKSDGKAPPSPNPTRAARRASLGVPDDLLLDGALEDALLAARPIHPDSPGSTTLYGSGSGTGSKSNRHPLSTEMATMHLLFGNKS